MKEDKEKMSSGACTSYGSSFLDSEDHFTGVAKVLLANVSMEEGLFEDDITQ